jgi:hypothetical protein
VAEVEWHVFECVFPVFGFFDQGGDGVAKEALVLGLRVEFLARELDDGG